MDYGPWFLRLKLVLLLLGALVYLAVMAVADRNLGNNQLMSFISAVTLLGVVIGFGSADSLTIAGARQVRAAKRIAAGMPLAAALAVPVLYFQCRWANLALAALGFGSSFWNQGLIRRWNPLFYERIIVAQMLVFWLLYLMLLRFEGQHFPILALMFVASGATLALIAYGTRPGKERRPLSGAGAPSPDDRPPQLLISVSGGKVAWDFCYSALTRLPFVFPSLAAVLHSAFSYAYFLFEMSSALLSHRQSTFLHSPVPQETHWRSTATVLARLNALACAVIIVLFGFAGARMENVMRNLGRALTADPGPFDVRAAFLLLLFLVGVTWMQVLAYGRYALKLEASSRTVIGAVVSVVVAYGALYAVALAGIPAALLPFVLLIGAAVFISRVMGRERERTRGACGA